ncbi:MAG: hypothetical protein Q7U16_10195 [Agitococcus sp.]|nr:hypothetical protein [Agitococcus sp.]
MPKFLVTKKIQYTEEVEVVANSKEEAEELARSLDGTKFHDDHLVDCYSVEING